MLWLGKGRLPFIQCSGCIFCTGYLRPFTAESTVDNGSEFSAFSQVENWGCAVYFAHPYTSWERPQNERHNGLFRVFVPKGVSIEAFSAEYILAAADELNGRPRKKLGYRTPEELFDEFLDSVYAAEGCGSIAQDGSQRLPS